MIMINRTNNNNIELIHCLRFTSGMTELFMYVIYEAYTLLTAVKCDYKQMRLYVISSRLCYLCYSYVEYQKKI